MSTIAASAGLAKGTLYLYFRTREEIFLVLFTREIRAWLSALGAALPGLATPEDVLDWIADSLSRRKELLRLGALLHGVLERNVPIEPAREFKLTFDIGLSATAGRLTPILQLASDEEARHFLRWLQVGVLGLSQMAYPSPAVEEVISQDPRLAKMKIHFRTELRTMLGALLVGVRKRA